jgi:hypothetical protein
MLGRILGMVVVFLAIPMAHALTSKYYHRDGSQEFGLMIMSFVAGVFDALIYLLVATVARLIVRKRSVRIKWWVEGLVLGAFFVLLFYANL